MHCQHDNGFWLLLVNFFSFLPHMLRQRLLDIEQEAWYWLSLSFIPKRVLLFDVAATPNPPTLQIAYRIIDIVTFLQQRFLFHSSVFRSSNIFFQSIFMSLSLLPSSHLLSITPSIAEIALYCVV
jgi:hypothetical protein